MFYRDPLGAPYTNTLFSDYLRLVLGKFYNDLQKTGNLATLSCFRVNFRKKARNFLARDGPGSFDQPDENNIAFLGESLWLEMGTVLPIAFRNKRMYICINRTPRTSRRSVPEGTL